MMTLFGQTIAYNHEPALGLPYIVLFDSIIAIVPYIESNNTHQ